MKRKICIMDTNVFEVWLELPGRAQAGPSANPIRKPDLDNFYAEETKNGSQFVLPYAVLVETGNHISQLTDRRNLYASKLAEVMIQVADSKSPWAPFDETPSSSAREYLRDLAARWPKLAESKLSLADYAILQVVEYYKRAGYEVELKTADGQLQTLGFASVPRKLLPPRR